MLVTLIRGETISDYVRAARHVLLLFIRILQCRCGWNFDGAHRQDFCRSCRVILFKVTLGDGVLGIISGFVVVHGADIYQWFASLLGALLALHSARFLGYKRDIERLWIITRRFCFKKVLQYLVGPLTLQSLHQRIVSLPR